MEENQVLNLNQIQILENLENEVDELEEISIPRKAGYYGLLFIGTLAILTEVPFAKFCFDANVEAIDKLHNLFFKDVPLSPIVTLPLELLPTVLNGIADALSIQLLREARSVLQIQKLNDGKLYRIKPVTIKKEGTEEDLPLFKKGLRLFLFKGAPSFAMILNFVNSAFSGTLPINKLFSGSVVFLKYPVGFLVFSGGLGYSILLSCNDILNSFEQFRHFSQSPVKLLFSHSKIIALMPLTRFLVALINETSTHYYIAKKVCNEIFQLPQYSSVFGAVSISACVIVKIGTVLIPSFKTYLIPFEIAENQYNLKLFDQGLFIEFENPFSFKEKCQMILVNLPLSLIRGFGMGFFLYSLIQNGLTNHNYLDRNFVQTVSTASSTLLGLGFFLHTAYCDVQNGLNLKKKEMLLPPQTEESQKENCEKGTSFLSFMINLGCQVTSGFLSIASITTLFTPLLGEETAATLGIFIALEKGWISFRYIQPKIKNQLSELWKYRPSFCSFFKRENVSHSEEIVELNGLEFSSSENLSGYASQSV